MLCNNRMNKTHILSGDTLKTMLQGALGAMSFGVYHQFTTNKMMELNNVICLFIAVSIVAIIYYFFFKDKLSNEKD